MTRRPKGPDNDPFAFVKVADTTVHRAAPSGPSESPRLSALIPEDVVDQTWTLKTTLGQGGFGVVFEAERIDEPDAVVALKVMAPDPQDDGRWARRFAQEAEVAIRLQHPNVVRTLSHGRLPDGGHFLVMELLEGRTLGQRLQREPRLSWSDVAHVLESLGSGLSAVHEAGIVHRDVTPANVFLTDGGESRPTVKLIDFGLCKGPTALTASAEQMGTLPYIAPEAFWAAHRATAAVDVYGMGLIAYEIVTGRRAMAADSKLAMVHLITRGGEITPVTELRPDAPAQLVRLIEKGMDRDPKRRPADAAVYGRRLAAAVR